MKTIFLSSFSIPTPHSKMYDSCEASKSLMGDQLAPYRVSFREIIEEPVPFFTGAVPIDCNTSTVFFRSGDKAEYVFFFRLVYFKVQAKFKRD